MKFEATKFEVLLMMKIVKRAEALYCNHGIATPESLMTLLMDLEVCHCNGCALDLESMLHASDSDFSHDIGGIRRHINRKTGELGNCFVPRFAMSNLAGHIQE